MILWKTKYNELYRKDQSEEVKKDGQVNQGAIIIIQLCNNMSGWKGN